MGAPMTAQGQKLPKIRCLRQVCFHQLRKSMSAPMSALPPLSGLTHVIAAGRTRAISGCEQLQQGSPLFDHRVDAQQVPVAALDP